MNIHNLIMKLLSSVLLIIAVGCCKKNSELPDGFVFLTDVEPAIIENTRYYTNNNFLGRPVVGYPTNRIICTKIAAQKLKLVQEDLRMKGYKLVVYDAYRPQRSVNEFMRWSKDESDQIAKEYYYPSINKKDVFKLGYVAEKSSHSRGSTFDITLIKYDNQIKPIVYSKRKIKNGQEIPFLDDNTVDMGSSFDLFHEVSHHDNNLINADQMRMRNLLRDTMRKYGFKEYQEEWWHYTLENEPYPDTYFDFINSGKTNIPCDLVGVA